MPWPVLAVAALLWCALVLFTIAFALRRRMPARRAAFAAVLVSAVLHAAAVFLFAESERWLPLTLFWLGPHLLLLPVLLFAAWRHPNP